MTMLQLIPSPPSVIAGGSIRYNGADLLRFDEERMRTIRGNEISMIFQDPMTSLNPVLTVGEQIAEAAVLHQRARPARGARAGGGDAAARSTSPSRSAAPTSTRTSSPAACASAR